MEQPKCTRPKWKINKIRSERSGEERRIVIRVKEILKKSKNKNRN